MKKPSTERLKAKLDELCSKYARLRNADEAGYVRCVSCGTMKHWKDMDAGHFVSRRHLGTRWDIRNINPECRHCNRFSSDHLVGYTIWMMDEYGPDIVDELWAAKWKPVKFTRTQLEEMVDDMATRLARIALNPGESEDRWALDNVS